MTSINNLYYNFELYFEGAKIPTFNSIQISEQENNIPAAQISFAPSSKVLRILPGTIVHVFANYKDARSQNKTSILLFEGEITSIGYTRTGDSEMVSFRAISLLGMMMRAKLRPAHAIITAERSEAEMIQKTNILIQNNVKDKSGKQLFAGQTITNKTKTSKGGDSFSGSVNQLRTLAEFGSLADTLANQLAKKDTDAFKGNYNELFKQMQKFFHASDLYYGINAIAYKIPNSIFALPNPFKTAGFDLKVAWEGINNVMVEMNKDPLGASEIHTLMGLLEQFKKYMCYKTIAPSSFPGGYFVHNKASKPERAKPFRFIFMPDIESGPQPLCNMFLGEQVSSLSFSRDFLSEPTRVIGQMNYSFMEGSLPAEMMPLTVMPDLNLSQPKQKRVVSQYTDEESYRGVVLKTSEHDGSVVKAMYRDQKIVTDGKVKPKPPKKSEIKQEIQDSLRKFVLSDYLNLKYGQRSVQLQAEWNPNRLVGLPAMFIDTNKPTIAGVLAQVNTQINASGQAISSYVFRNCKLIFDEDQDSPFQKDIKPTDTDLLENYVVSDFNNGGMLGANSLMYDEEIYGFDNIGKEIYPFLINGELYKDTKFFKFFNSLKYQTTQKSDLIKDTVKDMSILKYVDKKEFDKTNDRNSLPVEVYNTKLIYEAIREFKKVYKQARLDNIDEFIDQIIKRRIITKTEYQTYMDETGFQFDEDSSANYWQSTCKDLAYILQNTGLTTEILQETILNLEKSLAEDVDSSVCTFELDQYSPKNILAKIKTQTDRLTKLNNNLSKQKKSKTAEVNKLSKSKAAKSLDKKTKLEKMILDIDDSIKANTELLTQLGVLKVTVETKHSKNPSLKDALRNPEYALFKPFNVTRRAHVQELLKDFRDIDNTITVIK